MGAIWGVWGDTAVLPIPSSSGRLSFEGCLNIRDVGGYATLDDSRTRWRALLRGDNLCRLTPDDQQRLLAYGVRTVVDVRRAAEIVAETHPFGPVGPYADTVAYRCIQLRDPSDAATEAAFDACPRLIDYYELTLDRCGPGIAAVVRAFANARPGAVVIHCNTGMNRTGVVVALLLALADVTPETIVVDYALSDLYLRRGIVARRLLSPEEYEYWRPTAEVMRAFLARLTSVHGGPRRYLSAAGLAPEEIDRARARLRE